MKKILSVVLTLAMLASLCVYLPLGISASEAAAESDTTLWSEDFSDLTDGTYTATELATAMGWTLLRGNGSAAVVTVADGAVTVNNTAGTQDYLFQIADGAGMTDANFTLSYDLQMVSWTESNLFFAAVYPGAYDSATGKTKAAFNKTTFEGYSHVVLADNSSINEQNLWAFTCNGAGQYQARSENILWGGGYGKSTTMTTWKSVYDLADNQLDAYASGAYTNSSAGDKNFAGRYELSQYVGDGDLFLRVQKNCEAKFDNISVVAGGEARKANGNVAYEQTFDGITYDPATETARDLADKIGFQYLSTPTVNNSVGVLQLSIVDGALDIFAPATESGENTYIYGNMSYFGSLYVPEMETAEDTVVFEYDLNYVNTNQENEFNGGDHPVLFKMYGRRSDFHAEWSMTQKGWLHAGAQASSYLNKGHASLGPGRPEGISYNNTTSNTSFGNGTYHMSNCGAVEHIKVVFSKTEGWEIYVNNILQFRLSGAELTAWQNNSVGNDIMGNIFYLYTVGGCHVRLDNLKVTIDPELETPDLLITEANVDGFYEYVEVTNNSSTPINIYDYCVTETDYASYALGRKIGGNVGTKNINLEDIFLLYPGEHTYSSVKEGTDYTYTVTNPAYAEGVLQPGETVLLWNHTDAMHNGGYGGPSAAANGHGNNYEKTLADFRTSVGNQTVRIFSMYNDYNRAFNNSGGYWLGLAKRTTFQPSYDPATGEGSQALTAAAVDFTNLECVVYMTANPGNEQKRSMIAPESTMTASKFVYRYNNSKIAGTVCEGIASVTGFADVNPGVLDDNQKRDITITLDSKDKTMKLGETLNLAALTGDQQLLYATVDGVRTTSDFNFTALTNGTVITRTAVGLKTLDGVSLRISDNTDAEYDDPHMRWVSAVNSADLAALKANSDITNIEFGTLIAKVDELAAAEDTLTLDCLYDAEADTGTVRKVRAYDGYWYTGEKVEDYSVFAGTVAYIAGYDVDFIAISYLTVTFADGTTATVYGDVTEDQNVRNVREVLQAIADDLNNGLSEEVMAKVDEYLAR